MIFEPVSPALGAEIKNLDLARPLDAEALRQIRQALADHFVIFFRDQNLSVESLVTLTKSLGPICRVPFIKPMPEHPDVIAVLKEADEQNISTFGGTWHSDFSFLPEPPSATLLYAVDVPEVGGDTLWCNMASAYEGLSAKLRALLDGLKAVHSGAPYGVRHAPSTALNLSQSVQMRRGDRSADEEVLHPVVRSHAESRRRALFTNPVYSLRFDGMTNAESAPLMAYLQNQATRPENTCRFNWRPGSLAIWDNRVTQHLAVNDYDGQRRLLYRTTVAGERPE